MKKDASTKSKTHLSVSTIYTDGMIFFSSDR